MTKIRLFSFILLLGLISCTTVNEHLTADTMLAKALEEVDTISAEELLTLMEGEEVYTLIDVREKEEHYYGYIPGSVILPRGNLEFNIDTEKFWETEGLYMPAKEEIIVLYCKKGKRSLLAAQTLQQMGFSHVKALDGGWKKWELSHPDYCEKNLDMLSGGNVPHDDGGGC